MVDQPNDRPARIRGHWRHLIHLSIFILGAAALYLRLSGDDGGYWNFILSNNSLEVEEGQSRHLLRDISRRTALANCNKFHRKPSKCNNRSGCAHNGSICVPEQMMMMQFSNMADDVCTQYNGKKRKCKKSGCAYIRSSKSCKLPSHECEAYNGRARICNRLDKCVFHPGSQQCDLMTQTSLAINSCTKKRYRACKKDSNCSWKNRTCDLKSGGNTGMQATATTTTTTTATTTTTTTTTPAATTTTTTTTTTPAAGSTTCLEWHPLPGQQTGHPTW